MAEPEDQDEVDNAGELGELIGLAVCSVIDYILLNSNHNGAEVERTFAAVAKKLVVV